jgi:hypothetical protein
VSKGISAVTEAAIGALALVRKNIQNTETEPIHAKTSRAMRRGSALFLEFQVESFIMMSSHPSGTRNVL